MKDKVLIVDDVEINRVILRKILNIDYDIIEAAGGTEAIQRLLDEANKPQAVLLDIMMPDMDGFEILQIMKSNPLTERIPVLFITAADANINESRGLIAGAVDYISKPFNPDVVKARVDNHIQLARYHNQLEALVAIKTADITKIHEQLLETMATIIEYRNLESGTHIRRTSMLTEILLEQMLSKKKYRDTLLSLKYHSIIKAVALHDIGKVGIPDSILLKPGKLTAEEFEKVKLHSTIGGNIIDSIAKNTADDAMYLKHCSEICHYHHERWDGKGYPAGLMGEDIPLSARVLSVVDVYDALVNVRCYKSAFTHAEAISLLEEGAGTQFDPDIIEILLEVESDFAELEQKLCAQDI